MHIHVYTCVLYTLLRLRFLSTLHSGIMELFTRVFSLESEITRQQEETEWKNKKNENKKIKKRKRKRKGKKWNHPILFLHSPLVILPAGESLTGYTGPIWNPVYICSSYISLHSTRYVQCREQWSTYVQYICWSSVLALVEWDDGALPVSVSVSQCCLQCETCIQDIVDAGHPRGYAVDELSLGLCICMYWTRTVLGPSSVKKENFFSKAFEFGCRYRRTALYYTVL